MLPVNLIRGHREGPTLLILGGVHGDEYDGMHVLAELHRRIQPEDLGGTLITVPLCNLPAFHGASRLSPIDGKNLAREFPGTLAGTITQRIAWTLHHKLLQQADFLLDIHSGGTHFEAPLLIGYYHDDRSELGRRSREAAEAFGLEVLWAHPEIAPGRTVSSATELGVPWLYTEAYGGQRVRKDEYKLLIAGVYRLLRHLRLVEAETFPVTAPSERKLRLYGDGNLDISVAAPCSGFFIPDLSLLEPVRKNERIGALYDLNGFELEPVLSPSDGIVVTFNGQPNVQAGDPLFSLTGCFNEPTTETE
jgi:predicted deacylase